MLAAGTDVTAKHFPGLGRASGNTDDSAGVTDPTTADDPYLVPFREGIAAGARYVMVSSATYPAIDPDRRAVFSPVLIGEVLRGRLGFDGVVMSDDLGAAAEVAAVPAAERALRFLDAGGDLLLTVDDRDIPVMAGAVVSRTAFDPAFQETVDVSALRSLVARVEGGVQPC